jgi:hypothetical protein
MIVLCVAILAPGLIGQEVVRSEVPPVFSALHGAWEGTGTLLGRPARFEMRWEVVGSGFVRLEFSNSWVGEDGEGIPVLSSQAAYFLEGSTGVGVWIDDRPQRIVLDVSVTDSSVVSLWTAEAEEGRTEYLVQSDDVVLVRDFVFAGDSERLFAEAEYRRRASSSSLDALLAAVP